MSVAAPAQAFKAPARTVATTVALAGVGLHTGAPAKVTLHPEEAGAGLAFLAGGERVPVHPDQARTPGGCTVLGAARTVEHLLAAVLVAGVTDLTIELDGPEVPGLDGSALPWLELIGEPVTTGWTEGLQVGGPTRLEAHGGVAVAEPAGGLEVAVTVAFPGLHQACQAGPDDLASVLDARTFLLHAQLDAVLAAGQGQGVRPGGVVVWGPRGSLVPLRSPDEPARHKALDLLGDLALVGCPVRGRFTVDRGSHALHVALVRAFAPPRSRSG
ncbi:MAG: UDP-3-O-acyl-N-acetylglucosamine deacetylase [Alphaproteobacteria bacterium]|nr:UDP-3-O-acyl-N-acetylglucosamine deacetylase [Alphaproteobacteria bacterium]MCB9690789.1 UDP-3-O-acyl-N-acetylglucosamine deacetylase [Alphaproteobacteria bacterium]